MATVKREVLSYNSTTWANWFSQFTPMISISGTDIVIDNKYFYRLQNVSGSAGIALYDMNDPSSYISGGSCTISGNSTVTVAASNTLFYMQAFDGDGRGPYFIYEKTTNFNVVAYTAGNSSFRDIRNFTLTDLNNGYEYKHRAMLNYTTQPDHINYAQDMLFRSNVKSFEDPNFVTCTTVQADRMITFKGENYYSVGTNTLVKST